MDNIIKYIYKKFEYLVTEINDKKYVYEDEIDKLELDNKSKGFLRIAFTINGVKIASNYIEIKDRPKTVKDLNYGEVLNNGMGYLDKPVFAKIKYCGEEIVFENYEELDEFMLKHFLPENVKMKVNYSRNRKDLNLKKPYPSVQLNKIVKLGLSELELKHTLELLNKEGIHVGGTSAEIEGEIENYDYIHSNDIIQNYYRVYCSDEISREEMQKKFEDYYETRDPVLKEELILRNLRLVPFRSWSIARYYDVNKEELESYGYEALINAVDNYNPYFETTFATYAVVCIDGVMIRGITEMKGIQGSDMKNLYYKFRNAKKVVEKESGCTIEEDPSLIDDIMEILVSQGYVNEFYERYYKKLFIEQFLGDIPFDDYISKNDVVLEEEEAFEDVFRESLVELLDKYIRILSSRELTVIKLRYGIDDGKPRTFDEIGKIMGTTRERIRQIEAKAIRKLWRSSSNYNIKGFDQEIIDIENNGLTTISVEEENNKTI